jgi:hypothetical protein
MLIRPFITGVLAILEDSPALAAHTAASVEQVCHLVGERLAISSGVDAQVDACRQPVHGFAAAVPASADPHPLYLEENDS